jgi:predicted aspartyl protease
VLARLVFGCQLEVPARPIKLTIKQPSMKICFCRNPLAVLATLATVLTTPGRLFPSVEPGTGAKAVAGARRALDLGALGYQPLELESNLRRSRWLVPVEINGKSCKLLLDTGSDFIMLRTWAPEFLGVPTSPTHIQAMTVGGARKIVVGESSLKLGTAAIARQHLRAMAQGDAPPSAKAVSPECGSLGLSALRGLGVALDIRGHTLWVPADPATRVAPAMSGLQAAAIPITRTVKSGHMVIEGKGGDRKIRMVLDSGAERTVLSKASAEAMKLPLTEATTLVAGASDANHKPMQGLLTNVTFGETSLPRLPVMVLPLKEVFDALSDGEASPIDGIIGADVLEQAGGIIDVAAGTLYLTGSAPPTAGGAAARSPEEVLAGHIVVPLEADEQGHFLAGAKVNGRDIRFVVDSGADTIVFNEQLAADLKVDLTRGNGTAQGADGKPFALATGKIASIELPGGIRVENQSFPFLNLAGFKRSTVGGEPAKVDGMLGQGFIMAARMIMDCGERRMLVPAKGAKPGEFVSALEKQGGKVVKLLRGASGKSYLPLALDGEEVALLIDTGSGLSTLDPGYAKDKSWRREQKGGSVKTLGQTQQLETVTVPATSFGVLKLPNVSFALVAGAGRGRDKEVGGRRVVGLFGMNYLRPLRAVLDFGSGQALFPVNKLKPPGSPATAQ